MKSPVNTKVCFSYKWQIIFELARAEKTLLTQPRGSWLQTQLDLGTQRRLQGSISLLFGLHALYFGFHSLYSEMPTLIQGKNECHRLWPYSLFWLSFFWCWIILVCVCACKHPCTSMYMMLWATIFTCFCITFDCCSTCYLLIYLCF